jgi:hypothetical protein
VYHHLGTYLFKFKEVNLPQVGTFRLVAQPATLDMGDKIVYPPGYAMEHNSSTVLPEHQLTYLSYYSSSKKDALLEQLNASGNQLQVHLETEAFSWSGVGKVEKNHNAVTISPELPVITGLQLCRH